MISVELGQILEVPLGQARMFVSSKGLPIETKRPGGYRGTVWPPTRAIRNLGANLGQRSPCSYP